MTEVLIVAKTRMGENYCCVGGLDLENNKNIRLLTPGGSNFSNLTNYEVGQIWDIIYRPRPIEEIVPPHVEDVLILRNLGHLEAIENMQGFLLEQVFVWSGSTNKLFSGKLKKSRSGSGYLDKKVEDLPTRSTGFWMSDCNLIHHIRYGNSYYYYKDHRIKFVGLQEPVDMIPAGTLLRVSLARWWRKNAENDERCYLQLSGWY